MDNHIAPKQAAKILGATTKTIQRWDKAGKIRCIRTPGGRRRIPINEIHKILGIKKKNNRYARVSSHTKRRPTKTNRSNKKPHRKDGMGNKNNKGHRLRP